MGEVKQLGGLGKGAERFALKNPISDTLKRPQPIIVANVDPCSPLDKSILYQTYCYICFAENI